MLDPKYRIIKGLHSIYKVENSVSPDQLASEKPTDQDLQCI